MAIFFRKAARFNSPHADDTPDSLFTQATIRRDGTSRFLRRDNVCQMLISTGGSCVNNGHLQPAGGCAFHFKGDLDPHLLDSNAPGVVSFRLENRGPSGVAHVHTTNRAELRAVIAALQFLPLHSERCNQLVMATDSNYVVQGATEWVAGWLNNGWRTRSWGEVTNRDLWESLLLEIRNLELHLAISIQVLFWKIPRGLNAVAIHAAREAAETKAPSEFFNRLEERP